MAYASSKPSPAGTPASSPLFHSPPVAQETSSLLLEVGPPGAQRVGDGGQRGHGRGVMGPDRYRWPRRESAPPVPMGLEGQKNQVKRRQGPGDPPYSEATGDTDSADRDRSETRLIWTRCARAKCVLGTWVCFALASFPGLCLVS